MSRKKVVSTTNTGNSNNTLIIVAIIGLIGTVVTAYFGFRANIVPVEISLTAESLQRNTPQNNLVATSLPTNTSLATNIVTPTIPATPNLPSVYIADWQRYFYWDENQIILHTASCKDDEAVSDINKYWVIYETWIWLTFVNSQDTPNGIIRIEPIYENEYSRKWDVRLWDITMYNPDDLKTPLELPVDLPPKTPRKWFFRAITVVTTKPEINNVPYQEYGEKLSFINWTFTLVNQEQVVHTSNFFVVVGDSGDGKHDFSRSCKELLPEWPHIGVPGRGISP